MLFGLEIVPVSFQSYIHRVFCRFFDIILIVYLNDILVFLHNFFQYQKYVWEVLLTIMKTGHYIE